MRGTGDTGISGNLARQQWHLVLATTQLMIALKDSFGDGHDDGLKLGAILKPYIGIGLKYNM